MAFSPAFPPPVTTRSGTDRRAGRRGDPRSRRQGGRTAAVCRAIPTTRTAAIFEAAIGGILVGCLYLPNGNPAPGPKFDYKLRWFERLTSYAKALLESGAPAILASDFNVM